MRRLPIYLLIDTSESMVGGAIESVQSGLAVMTTVLRRDPTVLEMSAVSVIAFGGQARQLTPLTELYSFRPPVLHVGPGTSLGGGIRILDEAIAEEIVKTTPERKGDYKPLIFILTDGQPTDEWRESFEQFRRHHKSLIIYAIGCGDDVDFSVLNELTEHTYNMAEMTADAFARLFVCITASIRSASSSIAARGGYQEDAIDLEKTSSGAVQKIDMIDWPGLNKKRQVFIHAVCSKTKGHYLLRYRLDTHIGKYNCVAAHPLYTPFSPTERRGMEKISTGDLLGMRLCPHCGNSGHGSCGCGNIICFGEEEMKVVDGENCVELKCPVCGKGVVMNCSSGGDFEINQSAG